jgi:FKBP-type peptidyl-prolyl cis-trans isomerase FkpA
MRLLTLLFIFSALHTKAADKDSTIQYHLPDSIKGVSFIADVNVSATGKKEVHAGISIKGIKLLIEKEKSEGEVSFEFPASAQIISTGLNTEKEEDEIEWKFNWQLNTTYKLMIATAVDTVEKFALYSGYIYLPEQQKWKLIGTCRINGEVLPLTDLKAIKSTGRKNYIVVSFTNVMVQPATGRWRKLDDAQFTVATPPPFLSNIDSVEQFGVDKAMIEAAIALNKTDVNQNIEGVYYKILNAGTGKSFTVNDSIVARYQLRLFGTDEVISGNETEQYTFLLKGLIKAWQLAVPLVKTGGRVKLVIPSGLAYSIRTRAPKIPPNSILEFYVDVVDCKTCK